eukprot:SAG31_NODE_5150_length_2713_cov_2.298776_1_plen_238_part_10
MLIPRYLTTSGNAPYKGWFQSNLYIFICSTNNSQVRALRVLEVFHHQIVLGGHGPANQPKATHRAASSAGVVEFRWWRRWVVPRSVEIVNLVFDRSSICLNHARGEHRAQRPLPALILALRPLCDFSVHAGASTQHLDAGAVLADTQLVACEVSPEEVAAFAMDRVVVAWGAVVRHAGESGGLRSQRKRRRTHTRGPIQCDAVDGILPVATENIDRAVEPIEAQLLVPVGFSGVRRAR